MSEVLLDYARPFLKDIPEDLDEWESALTLAGMIWTASMLGKGALETIVKQVHPAEREEFRAQLHPLVERRRLMFGWDPRAIVKVWVAEEPDGFRVRAASHVLETWDPKQPLAEASERFTA